MPRAQKPMGVTSFFVAFACIVGGYFFGLLVSQPYAVGIVLHFERAARELITTFAYHRNLFDSHLKLGHDRSLKLLDGGLDEMALQISQAIDRCPSRTGEDKRERRRPGLLFVKSDKNDAWRSVVSLLEPKISQFLPQIELQFLPQTELLASQEPKTLVAALGEQGLEIIWGGHGFQAEFLAFPGRDGSLVIVNLLTNCHVAIYPLPRPPFPFRGTAADTTVSSSNELVLQAREFAKACVLGRSREGGVRPLKMELIQPLHSIGSRVHNSSSPETPASPDTWNINLLLLDIFRRNSDVVLIDGGESLETWSKRFLSGKQDSSVDAYVVAEALRRYSGEVLFSIRFATAQGCTRSALVLVSETAGVVPRPCIAGTLSCGRSN